MEDLLNELIEERAKVWHEGKETLNRIQNARKEGNDPEAQDEEKWSKINADLERLDESIDQINERVKGDKVADEARANAERFVRPPGDPKPEENNDVLRQFATGKGPKALDLSLAGFRTEHQPDGKVVVNTLTEGTGSAGGDTVPTGFRQRLYEHLIENTAIRQTNVEVLTTSSGEDLLLPKTTAHTGAGTIVAEGGTIQADDPTVDQATLSTYKYPRLVQVSSELLQDTAVDLEGYLARSFGQAMANGAGAHFITGTGSGEPHGILTGGSIGVTGGTAQSGQISADEVMQLFYNVIDPHASRGWWIMRRQTLGQIRRLTDSNGQFLWQPGLAGSEPNTILDRPYVTDPNMPAAATSATSVAFGDFSSYVIRDVAGVRFERSDEFAFDQDLATFRVIMRTGGVPVGENGEWQVYVGNSS